MLEARKGQGTRMGAFGNPDILEFSLTGLEDEYAVHAFILESFRRAGK